LTDGEWSLTHAVQLVLVNAVDPARLGWMQVHKKHGQKIHVCTPHLAFWRSVVIRSMKSTPH